jgi:hypothetical protein
MKPNLNDWKYRIRGYTSGGSEVAIYRNPNSKLKKFTLWKLPSTPIAHFDTEEKARLFMDGFESGHECGFSNGFASCKRYAEKKGLVVP